MRAVHRNQTAFFVTGGTEHHVHFHPAEPHDALLTAGIAQATVWESIADIFQFLVPEQAIAEVRHERPPSNAKRARQYAGALKAVNTCQKMLDALADINRQIEGHRSRPASSDY